MCRPPLLVVALAVLLASHAGCQQSVSVSEFSVEPSGIGVAYVSSDLVSVYRATVSALQDDIGYTLETRVLDDEEALIQARTSDGRVLTIDFYEESERETKLEIEREGYIPDAVVSNALYRIGKRLK